MTDIKHPESGIEYQASSIEEFAIKSAPSHRQKFKSFES